MVANTLDSIESRINYCEHGTKCVNCCWIWKGALDTKGYPISIKAVNF